MFESFGDKRSDIEKYEDIEITKVQMQRVLRDFMSYSEYDEVNFLDVRKKAESLVDEFANLMGSLEKRKPEDTADHYVDFYFPVIEEIRSANSYSEINEALQKLDISKINDRFYELKMKLGILVKTRKGPYPNDVDVYKEFLDMQSVFMILSGHEKFINDSL